ncbi:MAG: HD domain-containing phosphohydrolase [Actinomycetota bacterium]
MTSQGARAASGVQLAEIVASIALAADLGLGQPLEHVLRACVIATRFAERLDIPQHERDATYWTTLFMAAGCTGGSFEQAQIFGDDIDFRAGYMSLGPSSVEMFRYMMGKAGAQRGALAKTKVRSELFLTKMRAVEESFVAHCNVSAQLAQRLGLGDEVIECLKQTFTRWDRKGLPRGAGGGDLRTPIAISVIATVASVRLRLHGREDAIAGLASFKGTWSPPWLIDRWLEHGAEVLAEVDDEQPTWDRVIRMQPQRGSALTEDELDDALELLGDYADLKSPWFSGHSRGVASLAAAAAREAGLPDEDRRTIRRAAWVHDIGRNGVPNSIWDKPGPLSEAEMERVRLHAYYTDRVLRRASRLAMLASIASAAHERADGSGYPRAIAGSTIPMLGRILEAADRYQAMLEDRPHRAAHSRAEAGSELRRAAIAGELDGAATDAVLAAAGHSVRRKPTAPASLTPREIEVLTLAARGGTTRAVARALGIAPKTAGNHLERIYTKIGVSTRAEATMFAMRHGLLSSWESAET